MEVVVVVVLVVGDRLVVNDVGESQGWLGVVVVHDRELQQRKLQDGTRRDVPRTDLLTLPAIVSVAPRALGKAGG